MKTKRLVTVVAVVAIVLSLSVLGTSVATAKVVKNVRQSQVADRTLPPQPPELLQPPELPHHIPGQSGQSGWSWLSQETNWMGLLGQSLLQILHFR